MGATMIPPLSANPDGTIYLVLDDFGRLGQAYRETDPAEADRATVLAALVAGEYRRPLRIVAFNAGEGWARDVTAEVAREALARAAACDGELPAAILTLLERAT
jgi:hypothetical protein